MGRVVVIASGETERKALPKLCRDFNEPEYTLVNVLVPPRTGCLSPEMALRLAKSVRSEADKIVVLVDADGKSPEAVLGGFRAKFQNWPPWPRPVLLVHAQWHLEAWFFADATGLRNFLKDQELGHLPANPDEIPRPKLRLQQLLSPMLYTSLTAQAIAATIQPQNAEDRSPSFAQFRAAMRNGKPVSPLP